MADRYREARDGGLEMTRRERERALRAYRRRLLRFGVLDAGDENDLADLEADGMAADLQHFAASELLRLTKTTETLEALDSLIALGERTKTIDPKPQAATQEIRAIRAAHPAANVLIYTEYADSQAALVQVLRESTEGEILAINGDDSEAERSRVAERFAQDDGLVLVSTDSLAEGLNLHERCFNLIHLDLPYNPNRLEQRNGRIDRYGQQRDPEIRYLYLAGTFEERLLLQLIQKYEKARAHLTFMPQTLAVTADVNGMGSGLIAGFAERQASLFDDEPVEIRTIDREAEATNSDAYRDLLREIDRAFAGFDRSAVRYGWQATQALPGNLVRDGAHLDGPSEAIDLPDFVGAAIAARSGQRAGRRGTLHIPPDWRAGLDGLPGFDAASGTFRFTRDHARLRDEQGRSLGTLGRVHPLVRRAITQAQVLTDESHDCRVALARADAERSPAILLTYSIELRSVSRLALLRMIAVLLPKRGAIVELDDPKRWLSYAEPARAIALVKAWQTLFADWVPKRQCEARSVAQAAMRREADRCSSLLQQQTAREALELQEWLHHRADDICGIHQLATRDLFGAAPQGPGWRFMSAPLDRLAAFAADSDNQLPKRREADTAVELFQRRSKELAGHSELATPMLHAIGMLMLVPAAAA